MAEPEAVVHGVDHRGSPACGAQIQDRFYHVSRASTLEHSRYITCPGCQATFEMKAGDEHAC